jgi:hypothetical protein
MSRSIISLATLILTTYRLHSQTLQITVDPPAGTLQTTFSLILANPGETDFDFESCCALPRISSLDGQKVFCPPCPPSPCIPESGKLPPHRYLRFDWHPEQDPCPGTTIRPGIYDVHWDGIPDAISTRVEILSDGLAGALGASPATVRFGETVSLKLKNTLPVVLFYNVCCVPPSILDPWGIEALCSPCVDCVRPRGLLPLDILTFDWTPGMNACNRREYPGRYRLQWGGLFDLDIGLGQEFIQTASVLVLPREERRVELDLSAMVLHPGETLRITARNPLRVPVYHYLPDRCNEVILLDAEGKEASCASACPPYQDFDATDSQLLLAGDSITADIRIPLPEECGQSYGRWSVIWGRFFGLTPKPDPASQVFGYAEINVLPPVFVRGDCDRQGLMNLADVAFFLRYLFSDGQTPPCLDACDFDDSGDLDLTDALTSLYFLFLGDPAPASPFPDPGPDPSADGLGCDG